MLKETWEFSNWQKFCMNTGKKSIYVQTKVNPICNDIHFLKTCYPILPSTCKNCCPNIIKIFPWALNQYIPRDFARELLHGTHSAWLEWSRSIKIGHHRFWRALVTSHLTHMMVTQLRTKIDTIECIIKLILHCKP